MKSDRKKGLQYVPGAADDGLGFFPVITCQIAGEGEPLVIWVVWQRRRQLPTKQMALAAAETELGLAFKTPSLPASPERFLDYLRERGFDEVPDYRVAKSFDEDRRTALGRDYQPAFGEEAARYDPALHLTLMQMVNQQIADKNPPETAETFERLLAEGHSPELARRLIGLVIVHGFNEAMVYGTPFDEKRFIENLRRLPEVPPL